MKEAYLYKKLRQNKVQCQTCSHYCLIENGKRGKCGVRQNKDGKLYSLVYGKACALNIDPIEKKPLYHFLPGTGSLSLATMGCNFSCPWCQNWQISQTPKVSGEIEGQKIIPENIVKTALKNNLPSISYTYTEPAVFLEYALDTMQLAKKAGLKNVWVSNGFWSKELFDLITPYLDAANIDLKSFDSQFYLKYCGGRLKPVLQTIEGLHRKKVHLEITTLVVPGLNDSDANFKNIAQFVKNLSPEIPWHISRFFPAWKIQHLSPTPVSTLKQGRQIGLSIGLKHIYLGNV